MINKLTLLLIILLFSVTLSACTQNNSAENKPGSAVLEEKSVLKADKIEIVNFHSTQRCASCSALGKYSEETIYEYFQAELINGTIDFKSINTDLPENKEIVLKYKARGSSLYINAIYDGKDTIEEDTRLWGLISNEVQFKNYLKNKINNLLGK